jgi:hypothetical protein
VKRKIARRVNLPQSGGQVFVATIFAHSGLAALADVCGFRIGDVLITCTL